MGGRTIIAYTGTYCWIVRGAAETKMMKMAIDKSLAGAPITWSWIRRAYIHMQYS